MGNRLSKIYTRTGDEGRTGLGDGTRVSKDHLRVEAFGAVDETNAAIGVLATHELSAAITQTLVEVRHTLFDLGGELSVPGFTMVTAAHTERLEGDLDALNADLAPLENFILPGGTRAAAEAHLARTVCRRAERRVYALSHEEEVNPEGLKYLNRLSDYLFVAARAINQHAGCEDVLWQPGQRPE